MCESGVVHGCTFVGEDRMSESDQPRTHKRTDNVLKELPMEQFRGTTIVSVRRDGKVAIAGDGQVSMGNTVMKGNARKVRTLAGGSVIAGFAGGTADAFTLFELFESKLEQYGNLTRAAIELACPRNSWDMPASVRPRSIPTLTSSIWPRYTTRPIHGHESRKHLSDYNA